MLFPEKISVRHVVYQPYGEGTLHPIFDVTELILHRLKVAFDLFLVIMAIANALDTPRMRNGEILARLNRDGGLSFLVRIFLLLIHDVYLII